MATIGRLAAVVDLGWCRFSGFFAWVTWLFIHLLYIVQFQNRLLILMQWGLLFFTRNRSARLITGERPLESIPGPPPSGDSVHQGKIL
jgi:NADH dehydrogenase